MTERLRMGYSSLQNATKSDSNLGPKKTMFVIFVVVGCFAILWPKVFYPMLVGSATKYIKPSAIDITTDVKQERPMQLRSELIHPAFRERGRAIPQPQILQKPQPKPAPRTVEGRPGPIPGMRPTIGGAGHVVPPPKTGSSSMSIIMPIYTIGIVIFFTYTLMKILFKKQPDGVGGDLYPRVEPDPHFRKEVFESERCRVTTQKNIRENVSKKLGWMERDTIVNAMSALLDEVDQEIEARRKINDLTNAQDLVNGIFSNGTHKEDESKVKVLGMELTTSSKGGKKWSQNEAVILDKTIPSQAEPSLPAQEIYLEGAIPALSKLLVADSATKSETSSEEDTAVVLSGKMTLSVISFDTTDAEVDDETAHQDQCNKNIKKPEQTLIDEEFIIQQSPELKNEQLKDLKQTVDTLVNEAIAFTNKEQTDNAHFNNAISLDNLEMMEFDDETNLYEENKATSENMEPTLVRDDYILQDEVVENTTKNARTEILNEENIDGEEEEYSQNESDKSDEE